MQNLKESLLPLFEPIWHEGNAPPQSIQDAEIEVAVELLSGVAPAQYGVTYELLSFENVHRYIMVMVCPDQAFYPDAIRTYLQKQHIQPIQQHSILLARNVAAAFNPQAGAGNDKENQLLLVFHFSAATTENIKGIERDIQHILEGVYQSVTDFSDMLGALENAAVHLAADAPEDAALLRWMLDDHYLLLGLIYPQQTRLNKGICKRKKLLAYLVPESEQEFQSITAAKQAGMQWLHLTSTFSHLYSSTTVRVVQICWVEDQQLRTVVVLGHFSRGARYINASQLPKLSQAWASMAQDVSLQKSAFYHREIRMLFDRVPKSLLHSIPEPQWLAPFKAIVDMHSPTQVVVEPLQLDRGNFKYLLIAVNSHRFGDNIWVNIQQSLQALKLKIWGSEGYDVGATHLIFVAASADVWPSQQRLHRTVRKCVVFWKDKARQALLRHKLSPLVLHAALAELSQISHAYQNQFLPEQFVADVLARVQVQQTGEAQVRLKLLENGEKHGVEIHILTNQVMPLAMMTEKLNAFALVTMEQSLVPLKYEQDVMHICRFRCEAPAQLHAEGLPRLGDGIQDVFNQFADHDALNALVILCGLGMRDVLVLIALRNHLAQLMPSVSIGALSLVMIKYRKVTLALFRIFEGKHRPAMPMTQQEQAKADLQKAMLEVQSLKEDTWLRALAELVFASVRCNAWLRPKDQAIAIKIDSSQLEFAPYPKPYREIFVHGVFVEGIHLRAGPIARGGLRFSDRPTDFRTEVLELMATQVVKNGQIVPTGAKGGFVVRDGQGADFVLAQYHQFIRALLSITDNRIAGQLVPPQGLRIATHDQDDAYLVVAADKGTARYSDDANEEALQAEFWLGDAFASGGSHGYDHKAFGITARGAWVCAEHHFARLGIKLSQDKVSAVGIGDMGGDVFGNGMLLNPNLQLIAAFNHIHIFLDPNPDVQAAFAERKRLFDAVKGWDDYQQSCISLGGGVFQRAAKSITLSAAVQQKLGIKHDKLSGEALIRAILQAPVDLLYNGGIGTYIKASFETDADAQDPANNAVRVNANTLRCKVLSEGGNLGLTHDARVEYALQQGILNTDAIDNAAGVNMSDHEVNLKILLTHEPFKQRNQWLLKVADEVAKQCLDDNKAQAIALSLAEETTKEHLPRLQHLQQCLYDEDYITTQQKEATYFALRPVLSEWLGHEKNRVHQALDTVNFRSLSVFGDMFLYNYFPVKLHKKFHQHIKDHALADDIAHTRITSYILNRYGLTSIHYLQNLTSSPVAEIVQVVLIADALLETGQTYETLFAQVDGSISDWYQVQQHVLHFAESLLALQMPMQVDASWLKATRKTLVAYGNSQNKTTLALVPLSTAIALAEQVQQSLEKCLHMTQACLDVLPFTKLEASLRTSLWASDEAHALRCEWLGRLTLMKIQAAKSLLQVKSKQSSSVLKQWQAHPLQVKLAALLKEEDMAQAQDEQRLRYILALTHLQSIVECECHLA